MEPEDPSSKQQALFEQAIALHQSGQLTEAAAHYNNLLNDFPDDPQLLTALGTIALQQNDFAQAAMLLGRSLQSVPEQPYALVNHGLALAQLNRLDEALTSYDQAIALIPDYADTYYNRGNTLRELKRLDEAIISYDHAIALKADFAQAYSNRGLVLQDLQRIKEAVISYDQAIAIKPDNALVYNNRGNALKELKRLDEAIASFNRAIALKPDFAEACYNLGNALKEIKQFDEALPCYDRAIALKPDYAEAYNNKGATLKEINRFEAALNCFDQAIALKPDYAQAYNNKGATLKEINQFEAALNCFDRAIALKPDFAEAYNNRGSAFQKLNKINEALSCYDKAIALKPDFAEAYWNKSFLKILTGNYEEGWRLFEWRWQSFQNDRTRGFTQPLWLGEQSVADKTILIHPEQGFGDFIQFCRYIPMLETLGAKLVIEAPAALIPLLSTLKGNFTIVETGQALPGFDLHCPIMSLPFAFKTTVSTIPASVPYLYIDSEKQRKWQERLGHKTKTRVGLAWSGSRTNINDRNRSIPLKFFEPILRLPFEFHSLQKEIQPNDAAHLKHFEQLRLHHDVLSDFSQTAALINEMDLVISVDTSVAHLAGALAKPVFIPLPFAPDYRWMLDRVDSPWYPTATLLRQTAIGDWPSVISNLTHKLEDNAASS